MNFRRQKKRILKQNRELEKAERLWSLEKPILDRKFILEEEQKQYVKKWFSINLSTSKLLISFLFINCTLVELFTGWAMIKMLSLAYLAGTAIDFTPLVALIGAIVSEVIGYAIYSLKAMKENSSGGIVYDLAMKEQEPEQDHYYSEDAEGGM